MSRSRVFLIALAMALLFFSSHMVRAGSKEVAKVETAHAVLDEIMAIPEQTIPPSLLHNAYGVAVIPGVLKAGFIVGGRGGRGVLAIRANGDQWSNPAFITLAGGSIGYQIGAQSTDIILVFKTRKSIDGIIRGTFTLGADAAVAAGPVGRQAGAATDAQLKAEIYSYSRSRGLFAGVALDGTALHIDNQSNSAFYGREGITPSEIFQAKGLKAPAAARDFREALERYVETSGSD